MKKTYLIAILVIGIALGFTMWSFSSTLTPYVDLKTARQENRAVQVLGKILHETARFDPVTNTLRFEIEDRNKERVEVVYHKGKPEAFDTAPETAATGMISKDPTTGKEVFVSDRIVVKCDSKYESKKKDFYRQAQTAQAGQ